jgi:hypothetical protein
VRAIFMAALPLGVLSATVRRAAALAILCGRPDCRRTLAEQRHTRFEAEWCPDVDAFAVGVQLGGAFRRHAADRLAVLPHGASSSTLCSPRRINPALPLFWLLSSGCWKQ